VAVTVKQYPPSDINDAAAIPDKRVERLGQAENEIKVTGFVQ
jgi:hypothetical protein